LEETRDLSSDRMREDEDDNDDDDDDDCSMYEFLLTNIEQYI